MSAEKVVHFRKMALVLQGTIEKVAWGCLTPKTWVSLSHPSWEDSSLTCGIQKNTKGWWGRCGPTTQPFDCTTFETNSSQLIGKPVLCEKNQGNLTSDVHKPLLICWGSRWDSFRTQRMTLPENN